MRKTLKRNISIFVIAVMLAASPVFYVIWKTGQTGKLIKPYGSYIRLVNLASGFDDFKKQNGEWPADTAQLVVVRPDLGNDTTDSYGHDVVFVPYNEAVGYGEFISYGQDGMPGGNNKFDRDIVIRFPMETKANAEWNKQVADRFKSRTDRGLW
jgi:hypothetical protein